MNRKAFTLIELLIVIAIIAILALIAIPNFLEAQVRARTSRAMADMKTIGTALHAYTQDYGIHPYWSEELEKITGVTDGEINQWRFRASMTTPVAYLSSWPIDAFKRKAIGSQGFNREYDYRCLHQTLYPENGSPTGFLRGKDPRVWNKGYIWWTETSPNPTPRFVGYQILNGEATLGIYDPTNGTASAGLILHTNKGFWHGQDYVYVP